MKCRLRRCTADLDACGHGSGSGPAAHRILRRVAPWAEARPLSLGCPSTARTPEASVIVLIRPPSPVRPAAQGVISDPQQAGSLLHPERRHLVTLTQMRRTLLI